MPRLRFEVEPVLPRVSGGLLGEFGHQPDKAHLAPDDFCELRPVVDAHRAETAPNVRYPQIMLDMNIGS
jgi:hypothetical protein